MPRSPDCNVMLIFNILSITCLCLSAQGLAMRQIRFRFDGQPINETDTPSQVRLHTHTPVQPTWILHSHFLAAWIREEIATSGLLPLTLCMNQILHFTLSFCVLLMFLLSFIPFMWSIFSCFSVYTYLLPSSFIFLVLRWHCIVFWGTNEHTTANSLYVKTYLAINPDSDLSISRKHVVDQQDLLKLKFQVILKPKQCYF